MEIQTRALVQPSRLHAGEQVGDVWVHEYKKYAANEEGGGRLRGGEGSMFAADVEAEAEEDALGEPFVGVAGMRARAARWLAPTQSTPNRTPNRAPNRTPNRTPNR